MTTNLQALAELVGGVLHGDGTLPIHAARPISEAGPEQITFLENDKYLAQLTASTAAAAVVPNNVTIAGRPFIQVADPLSAFVAIASHLEGVQAETIHGIDPQSSVHPSAKVGAGASIHPFAAVGPGSVVGDNCRLHSGAVVGRNCRLGDGVTLHPHAVLYDGTIVGDRVIIHSNAVIGADGFGYRFQNGRHVKVPQIGHVEIGDDVEIGAGATIDRGTFSATRIGSGTKIDNLVQIAHNCQIGRHNIMVSQVGMAGSSSTGDYVVIAGQVGVVEHVHIGEGCVIGGQAAVTKDVPPGSRMLGSPATPEKEQKRILMSLLHLPEFRKELRTIQERLGMAG
ncbi:MAG: UDP-3-O-(3-hydroxymyristoyl)glucosamine N-acyltransferase [Gemmataceae bacterium]